MVALARWAKGESVQERHDSTRHLSMKVSDGAYSPQRDIVL